jgi:hypothetical protein
MLDKLILVQGPCTYNRLDVYFFPREDSKKSRCNVKIDCKILIEPLNSFYFILLFSLST